MSRLPLGADPSTLASSDTHVSRALIVDDEEPVRRVLNRWFNKHGWSVTEASDGDQARMWLTTAANSPFDLVICDVRMPELSGPQLYDWLAEFRPSVIPRLVFTTGDRSFDGVREFLVETRCTVLEKPFELHELQDVVQRVVSGAVGMLAGTTPKSVRP